MTSDTRRATLKRTGEIFVDGTDTGWTWIKTGGFHPEYRLVENGLIVTKHYNRKAFIQQVLDCYDLMRRVT